jgi:ABC-type branched-subunit amino acid transport system ATPase component
MPTSEVAVAADRRQQTPAGRPEQAPAGHQEQTPAGRPEPVIRAEAVVAGYGAAIIVREVSITAGPGEVVTVVGPNGSGKSTLLKTLAGLITARAGHIWHGDADVTALPAEARARRGIAYLPQEREVFASLTVRENLLMGGYGLSRRALKAALERAHGTYPALSHLARTPAGRLSGGERKTVALARVMMSSPSVVLLDEPTASLAPMPSAQLLEQDVPALAAAGVAVILVEQRAVQAIAVSDWVYVLVGGAVELHGQAREIGARGDIGAVFLGANSDRAAVSGGAPLPGQAGDTEPGGNAAVSQEEAPQ